MGMQRPVERSTGRSTDGPHGPRDGSKFLIWHALLWQVFSWNDMVCSFEDLLQAAAGEQLSIQVPCVRPIQHPNKAPTFYTAWEQISISCKDVRRAGALIRALAERFKTRAWTTPLPQAVRVLKFPQCACCFAKFVLEQ